MRAVTHRRQHRGMERRRPGGIMDRRRSRRQGFALFLSLMLILILSVFAYWLMLVSESHYAASRALFESDNARILSEAALQYLVQLHNHQQPRFFADPARWNQLQLKPFNWNAYQITGTLDSAWNSKLPNVFHLRADKGRYASELQSIVRQIRLEDFALFSNTAQSLSTSTLFEGKVYTPPELTLGAPSRFRDLVFNRASPDFYASYRRKSETDLIFPSLSALFPNGWNSGSLMITAKNSLFWQTDHYLLDLDALDVSAVGKKWRIFYQGKTLGDVSLPGMSFDGPLQIRQTYHEIPWLGSGKVELSFYIASSDDVVFKSSIQSLQLATCALHLCFVGSKGISIQPEQKATRIEAMLVSLTDFFADSGSVLIDAVEKQSWEAESRTSAFLVEPVMKATLSSALAKDQKVLWFRGTIAAEGSVHFADDISQVHFESAHKIHSVLESFPYVEIVEGGEQWQ